MTIPASALVSVNPGVIGAGGAALDLSGLILTNDTAVPLGAVSQFSNAQAVSDFFGAASTEATLAAIYFAGYANSTQKPGNLLFSQYNIAAVGAYLRSGPGLTLAKVQAIPSGTLSVTVDGVVKTSTAVNLSTATSLSNAATIIAGAFTGGPAVTFDSQRGAFKLASATTGATSTISFGSGTIAAGLLLTGPTGAVVSQGAAVATPAAAMGAAVVAAQNWASFMTVFEPVLADKIAFATWCAQQNNRFAYACWDTDVNAVASGNTTAFGPQVAALNLSGSIPITADPTYAAQQGVTVASLAMPLAAAVLGMVASIDFGRTNGRVTLAYRSVPGVAAGVGSQTVAAILAANGYNFYGAYASASDQFTFLQPGQIGGSFDWIDSYVNQIWMNAAFQSALLNLLVNAGSIPYNNFGYSMIESSLLESIQLALDFGAIRDGVALNGTQAAIVNGNAGRKVDDVLSTRGWYLLVKDPGTAARAARTTPQITFFYTDGGSVQTINMASILVQ